MAQVETKVGQVGDLVAVSIVIFDPTADIANAALTFRLTRKQVADLGDKLWQALFPPTVDRERYGFAWPSPFEVTRETADCEVCFPPHPESHGERRRK